MSVQWDIYIYISYIIGYKFDLQMYKYCIIYNFFKATMNGESPQKKGISTAFGDVLPGFYHQNGDILTKKHWDHGQCPC